MGGCCDVVTGNCWARENCYRRKILAAMSDKAKTDPYWMAIHDQHEAELRDIEARFTDA